MPVIRIERSAGRTQQQKQRVAEGVTRSMVEHCGCSPEAIHVAFTDVKPSDRAIAGKFIGEPAPATRPM